MKTMINNFANEMKNQLITEIGSAIGQAIAAQNQSLQNELANLKDEQDILRKMIFDLHKTTPTPPQSYASVTGTPVSTPLSPNGRKSPVLRQPRQVDVSKFMKSDADESLFSSRVSKLRQSSTKRSASSGLVTLYALRVRDIQPKEIRDTLKQTTFNPRVIKDISYVSRNTMSFTVMKSSLKMLQDLLHGLFGWTTTLTFDPSKTFNPNAPDEIKDQVRSGSIRTFAKFLFRAEFITKDEMLLEHHRTFVKAKGPDYEKAVSQFIEVIKRSPTTFFPNYVPTNENISENTNDNDTMHSNENLLNEIPHNDDNVNMSLCSEEVSEIEEIDLSRPESQGYIETTEVEDCQGTRNHVMCNHHGLKS
jgi:hypothetical protein